MPTVVKNHRIVKPGPSVRSAALLLVTAVLTGACGSDSDPLTLEEYFAEFEAIDAEVDAQFEALFADFPDGEDAFADEANLEFFKELTVDFPRIAGDLVDRLKDLDPPSEVAAAHDELIDAGDALVAAFEEGAEQLAEAESMAEWEALSNEIDPTVSVPEAAFDAACLTVLDIARANDIHADVTCDDE